MHRLSSGFVLCYHGCDKAIGESLLSGAEPKLSNNSYDWLGPGMYFWEANPLRGLEFAHEAARRRGSKIEEPFVIGAVIDLGLCLDLTTSTGIAWVKRAFNSLQGLSAGSGEELPRNSADGLRRDLDCAVIVHLHEIRATGSLPPIDTVRGLFTEGPPIYPGAGIAEKTHAQIAICNAAAVKGFFRVRPEHLLP